MQTPTTPSGDQTLPLPFRNWIKTIYSWIKSRFRVVSVTGTYTVAEEVYLVLADATGGAFTVTLPSTTNRLGREIIIKRMNAGGNAVTLGGTIDGAVNPTLGAQYAYKRVLCDGINWNDVT